MGEMRVKRENERKEMIEINWEFAQIPSSMAILYSRKWLEIAIQRPTRVQKYNQSKALLQKPLSDRDTQAASLNGQFYSVLF